MKEKHVNFIFAATWIIVALLSGCTTATYGNKMIPIGGDVYAMKVYVGGPVWVGEAGSLSKIEKEAELFLTENPRYKYFEILDSRKNVIPAYYEYKIKYFDIEKN